MTYDAIVSQALCHILTESYLEFLKAIYKMNKAYKGFKSVYQASGGPLGGDSVCARSDQSCGPQVVFPGGISESDSLDDIFTKLNEHYTRQTSASSRTPASSSTGSGFFGWGKKRSEPVELKHSTSSTALPALNRLRLDEDKRTSASEPASKSGSPAASIKDLIPGEAVEVEEKRQGVRASEHASHPEPKWANDPLTTLVISGAAFGFGLFGLVFSLLP